MELNKEQLDFIKEELNNGYMQRFRDGTLTDEYIAMEIDVSTQVILAKHFGA